MEYFRRSQEGQLPPWLHPCVRLVVVDLSRKSGRHSQIFCVYLGRMLWQLRTQTAIGVGSIFNRLLPWSLLVVCSCLDQGWWTLLGWIPRFEVFRMYLMTSYFTFGQYSGVCAFVRRLHNSKRNVLCLF